MTWREWVWRTPRKFARSSVRCLLPHEIKRMNDDNLLQWYRKLSFVRNSGKLDHYSNPNRVVWCWHEARRELTRRGVRDYSKHYPELENEEIWVRVPFPGT